MIDIAAQNKLLQETIPANMRSVGSMRGLAYVTDSLAESAQMKILGAHAPGIDDVLAQIDPFLSPFERLNKAIEQLGSMIAIGPAILDILKDLHDVRSRVTLHYLPSMEGMAAGDPMPPAARPLYFKMVVQKHFTPDALAPFTLLNQWDAATGDDEAMVESSWIETIKDTVQPISEEAETEYGWLLAILAAAGVATAVYASKKKSG